MIRFPGRAHSCGLVGVGSTDSEEEEEEEEEEEAFFGPGQYFTIWADGLVGSTVQAVGRVGHGVIARRTSPARAPVDGNGIPGGVADQAVTSISCRSRPQPARARGPGGKVLTIEWSGA